MVRLVRITSETYQKYRRPSIHIRWIQSESRRPTSFRWVCELFDLEPGHLRGLLGQAGVWRKRWPTLRRVDRPLKILRGRRAA
jgi:hypothetical protein